MRPNIYTLDGLGKGLLRSIPALLCGAVGGAIFLTLRMPLAWMLGSMFVVGAYALLARQHWPKPAVDMRLRALMIVVLGVMLGSAFTPDMLNRWTEWLGLMGLMLVYVPLATACCYWIFRKLGGFDPATAYFAATPGGLQEMTMVGEAMGGNASQIILSHTVRVFIVVMTIPFYFRLIEGMNVPPMPPGGSFQNLAPDDAGLLVASGLIGWILARRLRMPAAQLVGPMLCSAVVHLAGFSVAKPPTEAVAVAQVVVGASLGCRFAGIPLRTLTRVARLAAGSSVIMLGLALGLVMLFAAPLGLSRESLTLVLAPGGLAEMSLVALALHVEVALVSSMHVFRIVVVVILAPFFFRLLKVRSAPK